MYAYVIKLVLATLLSIHISISIADDHAKHKSKLETISHLLNASSVSKHILNSGNDAAIRYYVLAKTAYKSAVTEYDRGNLDKSNFFIKESTDALSEATVFANKNKKYLNKDADHRLYDETK